jgi:hypothetical protein
MKQRFLFYFILIFGLFLGVTHSVDARRTYGRSHTTMHYTRSSSYHPRTYHASFSKRSQSHYHSSRNAGYSSRHPYHFTSGRHKTTYASGVSRDKHGRIKRSSSARHEFMVRTGYPHGRPGYVIDHIVPLKKGGSDSPDNMQWQTKADAKAKDKWE